MSYRRQIQTVPQTHIAPALLRRPNAPTPVTLRVAPPPPPPAAWTLDENWLSEPSNRQLAIFIVISLLIHAVVLKVHFTDPRSKQSDTLQPMLEVVLVNARSQSAPKNAEVLAQTNLDGGGNTDTARRAKTPLPPKLIEQPVAEVAMAPKRVEQQEEQTRKKLTHDRSKQTVVQETEVKSEPQPPQEALVRPDAAQLVARSLEAARLQAEIAQQLDTYSKRPRKTFVGSRAREYRFARYVEDWRIKVERVGNMNYPDQARQQRIYGSLQLTVSINADGTVERVEINKPSGHKVLDQAARRIVELAGPYAPFPPDIARDTDILSITRTWTFTRADELVSSE